MIPWADLPNVGNGRVGDLAAFLVVGQTWIAQVARDRRPPPDDAHSYPRSARPPDTSMRASSGLGENRLDTGPS